MQRLSKEPAPLAVSVPDARGCSKKGTLLWLAVLAACAFAAPPSALAASWHGPFPSTHLLDTPNPNKRLSLNAPAIGGGWSCSAGKLHLDIRSASDANVTDLVSGGCHGTGTAVNCTVTLVARGLPWTLTNPTTHNLTIHDIHITEVYENTPGNATACGLPGTQTLTGDLQGMTWTNPGHEIEFTDATGLALHVAGTTVPVTLSGTFVDTSNNLVITD
jgi:hypothetical protein